MRISLLSFLILLHLNAGLGSDGFAFARHVPERKDDIAFENDKVAFRIYGPALKESTERSGVDCWLKRVDYPIIDKWYKGTQTGESYHKDHGEGYDPYPVGASLGCGGLAIWFKGEMHIPNVYQNYRIVKGGSDSAVIEIEYEWDTLPFSARETRRITLEPRSQLFKVESQIRTENQPSNVSVAIGVTTHDGKALAYSDPNNRWVAAWENFDGSGLGTGVVLPKGKTGRVVSIHSKNKDQSHIVLITPTNPNGELTYCAGFAWEKAGEITRPQAWRNYLHNSN